MSENTGINFGEVPVATSASYLEPGMYRLKVDPAGTKIVKQPGKTTYLAVKFTSDNGAALTEKFFITAKSLPRLQYLHEAWFNKKLDRKFATYDEVAEYFRQALTVKPEVSRPMITGGKVTTDGKFFSSLPYTGFIVGDESLFEEGPFDPTSARYKNVVTIEKPNPAVANTNAALLPTTDGELPSTGYRPLADNENPW